MSSPVSQRRWFVTGAGGLLAQDLLAVLHAEGAPVAAFSRAALDITDPASVEHALAGLGPGDIVVNCAAWTAVDDAETHEAQAFTVNATGPQLLARRAAGAGAHLLHVSTDYVFHGSATQPYAESAALAPRSAYGRTKAAGEWAVRAELPSRHWILRTAWLYGQHGPSFASTMLRLERSRDTVDVVDDQLGQPTWSMDLAHRIADVVRHDVPAGTYHATASGEVTWFGLARAVFELAGADPQRVRPTTSAAFVRPAPRPAYSVLGHDGWAKAGLEPMREWRAALQEAMPGLLAASS